MREYSFEIYNENYLITELHGMYCDGILHTQYQVLMRCKEYDGYYSFGDALILADATEDEIELHITNHYADVRK